MPSRRPQGPKCLKRGGRITPDDSKYLRGRVEILGPKKEVGAHRTTGKEEVLIVLEGTATVVWGRRVIKVRPGFALFIGENTLHNVRNAGPKRLRYAYIRSLSDDERRAHPPGHGRPHH
jgi:mannose-6-phosphate isomerase-like protein (cupin superfamily)